MKTRSAVALPLWVLVGSAGVTGTLASVAVRASRAGCMESRTADLIAVAGVAGVGLGLATLLLIAGLPRYRSALPAVTALSALALSGYAMVASLTTATTCS
jgi:hypothetical protein